MTFPLKHLFPIGLALTMFVFFLTLHLTISTTAPPVPITPERVHMYPETWERMIEEMYEKVRGGEALNVLERGLLWRVYRLLEKAEFAYLSEKLRAMIEEIWDLQAAIDGETPYRPDQQYDEKE